MNSKEIVEKIQKRNKHVIVCGNSRNNAYYQYLKASSSYDNFKKAFYIALQLSKHDGNVQEEQLKQYEHLVKHFDQQLLSQLKERDYAIQKIHIETDNTNENDKFHDRVIKIEIEGLARNRIYYEFVDDNKEFREAKNLFSNEISLALTDGLITDIEHKIRNESMKIIDKDIEDGMAAIRRNYNEKRVHGQPNRFNYEQDGQERHGQERHRRGHNGSGRGKNGGGRGRNIGGRGRNGGGRGRNGDGQRRNGGFQRQNDRGHGRNNPV